ncbi:MAG: carbohydrate kinase family protein [Candidatus Ornithomonoglobus sp.]
MEKKYDIIGLATPGQDLVIELEKMPHEVSSKMYDCCFQGGGWVATALCAAGNLGMRASFCGVVGDDVFGRMIAEDFKYNNVDTSHLIVEKGKRSNFCVCITERSTKSKTIISRPGECREVEPDDIDEEYIRSARMLHVGFVNKGIRRAADIIHSAGGKVSVDAAYYKPYVYENYDIFDIFIGSEYYFDGLLEELNIETAKPLSDKEKFEVMRYVQSKGPEIVIFTFGADGCMGVYGDNTFSRPAMDVPIVDTTGAGDVFHGAFDAAYLNGMDVISAVKYATGVSSIKCTQMGGRAGIPDSETLDKFLRTGEIDYEKINRRVEHYKRGV